MFMHFGAIVSAGFEIPCMAEDFIISNLRPLRDELLNAWGDCNER
jgi:hypothetical protein